MVKKGQIQDAEGNIVYWHTSSDVVFDEETGNTVKEDIDTIKSALGMKSGPSVSVNIDANTLQGHDSSYFVSNDTVESKYLKKEDAATIYLESTDAANTYLSKTDASSTYATKAELSNKILYGTSVPSSLEEGQVYLVYE